MADDASIKWDTTYDKDWAAKVAEWEWTWEGEDTVRTQDRCPRCTHLMTREVRREAVRTLLALPQSGGAPVPVVVACNCTDPHEGRPEGLLGCGKQATFMLPL